MVYKPEILLLTSVEDFTVDYIIQEIQNREIQYIRINSENFDRIDVSYSPSGLFTLHIDGNEYILDKVKSVYFRRVPNKFPFLNHSKYQKFGNREWQHFLEGSLNTLDASWINPYFSTLTAEKKALQLHLAKALGLEIPASLISNSKKRILEFIDFHKKVIVKPVSHGLISDSENSFYSFYTQEIQAKDFTDKNDRYDLPIYLQEKIPNEYDLRVTVVGNKIFPVKIFKSDSDSEVDWRKPAVIKEYEKINLPETLTDKILKLNKRLNLTYSAMDFIYTNNNFVFLEVNPAGEWVWLDLELKLNIRESIVDLMLKSRNV
jgi:glutathione synthase/RimK-type ligase-like ATP-grasp enzyme